MKRRSSSGMEAHLASTPLCDCENPELQKKARQIVAGADDPTEASLRVFHFVRDAIPFNATLDIYQRASETLRREVVDYCNKINVQVALLRAAGIPARYHVVSIEKQALRHFIPGFLYSRLPSPVGHFWCECHLDQEWVACEALFDELFYLGMLRHGWVTKEQIPTIDWDGRSDLVLLKHWIVEERGIHVSYDELVRLAQEEGMPPQALCKALEWLPVFFSSRRTNSVRRQ